MGLIGSLFAGAGLASLCVAPAMVAQAQAAGVRAITCSNPASGATWRIVIDYTRQTVDSNAARITEADVRWHDPKDGGNYTLDLRSGALEVIVASSTGGYFLHDRCDLGR